MVTVINTGFGVSAGVGVIVVEVEVGVGVDAEDDRVVELLELVATGAGTGSTTVAVISAVTVGRELVAPTVFVVCSTSVVASAGASVDAPPSTLITE